MDYNLALKLIGDLKATSSVVIAVMSESSAVVWQAVIAATVTVILAYFQYRSKQSADAHFRRLQDVSEDTHTLVNSNMGVQLRLGESLSWYKANASHLPVDIAAAELATSKREDHEAKQAIVDERE